MMMRVAVPEKWARRGARCAGAKKSPNATLGPPNAARALALQGSLTAFLSARFKCWSVHQLPALRRRLRPWPWPKPTAALPEWGSIINCCLPLAHAHAVSPRLCPTPTTCTTARHCPSTLFLLFYRGVLDDQGSQWVESGLYSARVCRSLVQKPRIQAVSVPFIRRIVRSLSPLQSAAWAWLASNNGCSAVRCLCGAVVAAGSSQIMPE